MRTFLRTNAVALVSGALLAFSFPKLALFPLAWVALTALFYQAQSMRPWQGAQRYFVAGFVFHLMLLHWLMSNVYWAGSWAFWGYVAVCVYLALWWAAGGALWCWMRRKGAWGGGAVGLALVWVAIEYAQARALTGFGWSAVGYSQGRNLLFLQLASVGGVGLISFLVVLFNALLALALAEKGRLRLVRAGAAVLVLAAGHAAGYALLGEPDFQSKPLTVGLIQPDFPLEMKWDPEFTVEMVRNTAEKSRTVAKETPVNFIVWPEAVIMDSIEKPDINSVLASLARDTGVPLYVGSVRFNSETSGALNSSYLIDADGRIVDYYDKVHLVPFGEYVPFGKYLTFINAFVPAIGDAEHGRRLKVFDAAGRRFGPLICFEVLFGPQAEELRAMGADHLIVITNLGWFGASSAIPQELELARMRAVETRLPLVHSANTGISGVFDPYGRFALVAGVFDGSGNLRRFNREMYGAEDTVMQRVAGALPVAAPGKRPVRNGPSVFPHAAVALTGLVALAGLVARKEHAAGTPRQ